MAFSDNLQCQLDKCLINILSGFSAGGQPAAVYSLTECFQITIGHSALRRQINFIAEQDQAGGRRDRSICVA